MSWLTQQKVSVTTRDVGVARQPAMAVVDSATGVETAIPTEDQNGKRLNLYSVVQVVRAKYRSLPMLVCSSES